jgi:hypothetical protein
VAKFKAPEVDEAGETLTFKLTITDNSNRTAEDTVSITIKNRDFVNCLPWLQLLLNEEQQI